MGVFFCCCERPEPTADYGQPAEPEQHRDESGDAAAAPAAPVRPGAGHRRRWPALSALLCLQDGPAAQSGPRPRLLADFELVFLFFTEFTKASTRYHPLFKRYGFFSGVYRVLPSFLGSTRC